MKAANDDLSLKLRALSDPVRRKILCLLAEETPGQPAGRRPEMCAADLQRLIGLAQPTISHHLRILCEAGLVAGRCTGTWVWYSRDEAALRALGDDFKAFCG